MPDYPAGSVKRDPVSKTVAVKLPDGSPLGDWGFMSLNAGGGFISNAQVADWIDLERAQ